MPLTLAAGFGTVQDCPQDTQRRDNSAATGGHLARLAARPERALAAFVGVQVLCWTLVLVVVSTAPRLDVVEMLVWGREWQIGTFKHPPLPAWLAEIGFLATGDPILGPMLAGQLCVALTYLFVFMIGRRVTTPLNALVGVLLLAGVYYFTWPTVELNHNLVQLPIWSGAILLLLVARRDPARPWPWLLLGLVAGLGVYAKYAVLVLYFTLAVWIVFDRPTRRALASPWPWLGIGLAALVVAPHVAWLASTGFSPIHEVTRRGGSGSPGGSMWWLLAQVADHLPLVLLGVFVGYRRINGLPPAERPGPDLTFVAFFALGPAIATAAIATLTGRGLLSMWGMPMFTLSGLLAVLLIGRAWTRAMAARVLVVATGFVAVFAVAFGVAVIASRSSESPGRAAWPMQEIAAAARSAWYAHTDAPLRIVAGSHWLAGLVALGGPERPSVVYDGRLDLSPWLDEEQLAELGVLYVWRDETPPESLLPIGASLVTGLVPEVLPGGATMGYAVRLPATD